MHPIMFGAGGDIPLQLVPWYGFSIRGGTAFVSDSSNNTFILCSGQQEEWTNLIKSLHHTQESDQRGNLHRE